MLKANVGISEPRYVDGKLYWLESRPNEKGRGVVMRRDIKGKLTEFTPPGFYTRNTVHEYGGGSYTVAGDAVVFSNFADQRVYLSRQGKEPKPLTPADSKLKFADHLFDAKRNRVICVGEEHAAAGGAAQVENFLAAIKLNGKGWQRLEVGCDFYANPRLSQDGKWLAWISWNHPNMPWDGTKLWVARVDAQGALKDKRKVAGGPDESVMEPRWSKDGRTLYYVSDRSDWWNIYAAEVEALEKPHICLKAMDAEFGGPLWVFGTSSYTVLDDGRLACLYNRGGLWNLALISTKQKNPALHFRTIELKNENGVPYTNLSGITAKGRTLAFLAGSSASPSTLVEFSLAIRRIRVVKKASTMAIDPGYVSKPEAIEVPTTGGGKTYALFYAPHNRDFEGLPNERPPLVVLSHGGPTTSVQSGFSFLIQFYTSRGFAVADVNYRGSTGCGRAYRNLLRGQWGVVDWQDCESVATNLAERELVDGERVAIKGGSAGGYTTLGALAWGKVFKAGACHYGIGDLTALIADTHKFELRYTDRLVGPPEATELYRARNPINSADSFSCPVIFFQGLDDKVVPPNQSETMYDALKGKGIPVAYVPFEGEGHGFRQAPNIKRATLAEFYFFSKIFGFTPADEIEPVEIENLK
jgi:dipeptidyl aminopeptidase/acylaminoacyl peptidase